MSSNGDKKKNEKFFDDELSKTDKYFASYKFMKFVVIFFGIGWLINYMEIADLKDSYRAVINFPGSEETAEIEGREASERYVMMAAEFFTSCYTSATPATVDREFSAILQFTHPTRFGVMQERLNEEAEKLKRLKTVTMYGDVDWARGFSKQEIRTGEYGALAPVFRIKFDVARSIYVGSGEVPDEIERRTMAMDYVVENGRFHLLDLQMEERSDSL